MSRVFAATFALLLAGSAAAQSYPARTGERGLLDVPDADVSGAGGGELAAELRLDHSPGAPNDLGPLPMYAVAGLARNLDIGGTVREWGQPGDARPGRVLFGAAAKLQLWEPTDSAPGGALSLVADRVNNGPVLGARLAFSTARRGVFRVAAFGGSEAEASRLAHAGYTAGLAASAHLSSRATAVGELLTGPRGMNVGAGLRWSVNRTMGIGLGANYFPSDEAVRFSITVAFAPPPRAKTPPSPSAPAAGAPREEPESAAAAEDTGEMTRFRLRIPVAEPEALAARRPAQHAVRVAGATRAPEPARAPAVRTAAPTLEELAEAQLREQETLADGRERRVRATGDQLDAREKELAEKSRALDQRERDLASAERQLAEREARTAKITPTPEQRVLESMEAQLAGQERALSVVERSFGPALDSASRREREATDREATERAETARLAASVQAQATRAQQLEVRKQALAARNRQLAAFEARLVSKSEKVDVIQRQLGARTERLDCWSRRLAAHGEWLDAFDKRLESPKPKSAPPEPKPAEPKAETAKDKGAFVMTTKAPPPAAPAPAATAAAGEKAVAAATVVSFPSAASALSDFDREAIDNIARLAAREGCSVLVWARAKEPALQTEAERRVGEIKARLVSSGPLVPDQVKTRVTMRPGAQGVDVVISALRDGGTVGAPPGGAR